MPTQRVLTAPRSVTHPVVVFVIHWQFMTLHFGHSRLYAVAQPLSLIIYYYITNLNFRILDTRQGNG